MTDARLIALKRAAEAALPAWDMDVVGLELVSASENTVYRVDARDGRRYALRIHRPGYHTLEELNSELAWTQALNQAGIIVPKAVFARDGRGYITVAFSDPLLTETTGHRHVGVVEWLDGQILASSLERNGSDENYLACYRRLGALIAAMHNQAVAWTLPSGFTRHALDEFGLMGESPFWGPFWALPQLATAQRDFLCRLRTRLLAELASLPKHDGSYSLIHADLHPHNVMTTGDQLTVFDFDDAGFGWHAYDLAVAIAHHADRPLFPRIHASLLQGYATQRPLLPNVSERIPLFLLVRTLAILGWINGRPELKQEGRLPRLIERAERRGEAYLEGRLGLTS